jgi:hypothetical protein
MIAAVSKLIETSRAHLMGVDVDLKRLREVAETGEYPFSGATVLALMDEVEEMRAAMKKQAAAAIAGMDAAKRTSSIQLQLAEEARAETNPDVLVSERAANAMLTDELEALREKYVAAVQDAERAREERNRIGVEIRGEWMAKCEALRKDAERYRRLRNPMSEWGPLFADPIRWDGGGWVKLGSRWVLQYLDKAIDDQNAATSNKAGA